VGVNYLTSIRSWRLKFDVSHWADLDQVLEVAPLKIEVQRVECEAWTTYDTPLLFLVELQGS
jgi:hypothetical protein